MGGVNSKPVFTDVARECAQHPSAEKSVDVEGDAERAPMPAIERGMRTARALLRTVLDEEYCFFEKRVEAIDGTAPRSLPRPLRRLDIVAKSGVEAIDGHHSLAPPERAGSTTCDRSRRRESGRGTRPAVRGGPRKDGGGRGEERSGCQLEKSGSRGEGATWRTPTGAPVAARRKAKAINVAYEHLAGRGCWACWLATSSLFRYERTRRTDRLLPRGA
eukprot:scaffold192_cov331-Pavlova_lutheri.AAC.5